LQGAERGKINILTESTYTKNKVCGRTTPETCLIITTDEIEKIVLDHSLPDLYRTDPVLFVKLDR